MGRRIVQFRPPLWFALAALIALTSACGRQVQATATPTPVPTHTVHMLIEPSADDPRWFRNVQVPQGYDAYQLTEKVTKGNLKATWYPAFRSHFVESLIGVQNQGSKFWLIYLWDESSAKWTPLPVGADWFSVKDGHVLAWVYTDTSQEPAPPPTGKP